MTVYINRPSFDKYVEDNYTSIFRRYITWTTRPKADAFTMVQLKEEWIHEFHR